MQIVVLQKLHSAINDIFGFFRKFFEQLFFRATILVVSFLEMLFLVTYFSKAQTRLYDVKTTLCLEKNDAPTMFSQFLIIVGFTQKYADINVVPNMERNLLKCCFDILAYW